jgi:hypothetical protein
MLNSSKISDLRRAGILACQEDAKTTSVEIMNIAWRTQHFACIASRAMHSVMPEASSLECAAISKLVWEIAEEFTGVAALRRAGFSGARSVEPEFWLPMNFAWRTEYLTCMALSAMQELIPNASAEEIADARRMAAEIAAVVAMEKGE